MSPNTGLVAQMLDVVTVARWGTRRAVVTRKWHVLLFFYWFYGCRWSWFYHLILISLKYIYGHKFFFKKIIQLILSKHVLRTILSPAALGCMTVGLPLTRLLWVRVRVRVRVRHQKRPAKQAAPFVTKKDTLRWRVCETIRSYWGFFF